jgi:NAD(P)-dependent dehydrogenase (short-subunit alcohol dehydrogenase family)
MAQHNKTALVTGASRGIGRATALALAETGVDVLVHYGRSTQEAESLVSEIQTKGGRANAISADLGTPNGAVLLAKQVHSIVGDRLDVLVLNAGISKAARIADYTVEDLDNLFATNVRGPFFLVQQLLPLLRAVTEEIATIFEPSRSLVLGFGQSALDHWRQHPCGRWIKTLRGEDTAMDRTVESKNKALVVEAFDTLFNKHDYAAAEKFWSPNYIQHSAHIPPGREGVFNLIKSLPPTLKYEYRTIVAEGNFVILHGRFSNFGLPVNWIAADIVRIENGMLAEHWDVIEDEATKQDSKSGLPMFGEEFSR